MLRRTVISGLYQNVQYRPGNESVQAVARSLAALHPSYVTTLVHLTGPYPEYMNAGMIANYTYIRNTILASSPNCKFDILLAFKAVGSPYENTTQVVDEMNYVTSAIPFDVFNFDYSGVAVMSGHIKTVEKAIARAHSLGKLVTGHFDNISGLLPLSKEKQMMDYVWTDTYDNLSARTDFVAQVHQNLPNLKVMMQINQNPQTNGTNKYLDGYAVCCYFIQVMNTQQRIAYVSSLAKNQSAAEYYYQFNMFFPACPAGVAFNPLADGNYYQILKSLIKNYSS
jgi:hypothetical protein